MTVIIGRYQFRHLGYVPIPPLLPSPPSLSALPSAMLCSDIDMSRENQRVAQTRLCRAVDEFGNGNKGTMSVSS
ncbi:hypothetical protein M405DRAFT_826254 [Rhizopogon salebrosus TDB-379]|nr:hypothetical protein M405DRAFT_826254 [Rhizopogon salebrosus TDB-379]